MMRRLLLTVSFVATAGFCLPAQAFDIERVTSPKGIEAWLVHDEKAPVITMDFAFQAGVETDPADKQGLALLTASLLNEGAGDYDSQTFQKMMADNSISLGFNAGRDAFTGSLKTLVETKDTAVELAHLSLTKPRFDDEAIDRMKAEITAAIRDSDRDPDWQARRAFVGALFPNHPYSQLSKGTETSVAALTRADMQGFVQQHFARDQLKIAVAGDINAADLGVMVDKIFGDLPEKGAPITIADVHPAAAGQTIVLPAALPQTKVIAGAEGLKRDDPDWYAASLVNYILGGGGFNSRLMEEIREKRGLTYGISSGLSPMNHAALVTVGGSTANATAGQFIDLLKAEWTRMGKEGPTEQELAEAKTYLTGSFPLQLTSTGDIAEVMLDIQQNNLGIDYMNKRNDALNAVTLADARRVAARLFDADKLTFVLVGKPEGVK